MESKDKICILVPAKINAKENKITETSTWLMDMEPIANLKANHKDRKGSSKRTS
jgi:hypothetical protein